ncbi:MAG: hypothetical protein NTV82_05385 [Candidatus Aminicenantes bacterium]|nr:hypothetical protein [Candidatus Aminicenantes bacterium]
MKRPSILVSALLAALVFSQALALQAQDQEKNFYGNFTFGYRAVDTSGATDKYREHINLEKGVRLFNFNLTYLATNDLKKLFDRIDVNVYNFGGDPFETFSLSIQKYGAYKFQFNRRKSDYFYGDQVGPRGFFDTNSFDFSRISDSGMFSLTLTKNINVFLNFDRYTKSGSSVTTFDINRLEIETDKPLSEKLTEVAFGFDLHINRYSLVFEERIQDYKNSNSLFLPGYADGGPGAAYPASLDYFRLNQPYDFKSNFHIFRINARPLDNLIVKGSALLSKQDTNLTYSEQAGGIDYLDRSFTTDLSGTGKFKREIQLYDLDLTYLLFDKLAVIGAVRYNNFDQTGSLTINGVREVADFGFGTLGIEAGLQYQFSPRLTLTAGYRHEKRTLKNPGSEEGEDGDEELAPPDAYFQPATFAEKTVRNSLFGNVKWDFKNVKLTLDYQHGNYDDPFTLISPTLFDRLRATARYQRKGFSASAGYLMTKTKNDIPGGADFRIVYGENGYGDVWKASNNQFNLRLGYNAAKINASAGYSHIDFKSDTDRRVGFDPYWSGPAGTFLWPIHYQGKSTLLDASFSYVLDKGWKVGAYVNSYTNSGYWPIDRTMLKGYLEYTFPGGYITQIGYRYVNFKEKDSGFNDYKANILEFSFGYRWE